MSPQAANDGNNEGKREQHKKKIKSVAKGQNQDEMLRVPITRVLLSQEAD